MAGCGRSSGATGSLSAVVSVLQLCEDGPEADGWVRSVEAAANIGALPLPGRVPRPPAVASAPAARPYLTGPAGSWQGPPERASALSAWQWGGPIDLQLEYFALTGRAWQF